MGSCNDGLLGSESVKKIRNYFQGDDWEIPLTFRRADSGNVEPLTNVTAITIKLKKVDGTYQTFSLADGDITITDQTYGKAKLAVDTLESALIDVAQRLTFDAVVTKSTGIAPYTVRFSEAINILARKGG